MSVLHSLKAILSRFFVMDSRREKVWFLLRTVCALAFLAGFFLQPSLYSKTTATGLHLAKKTILLNLAIFLAVWALPSLRPVARAPQWFRILLAAAEVFFGVLLALVMGEKIMGVTFLSLRTTVIRFNYWLAFAICVFFFALLSSFLIFIL